MKKMKLVVAVMMMAFVSFGCVEGNMTNVNNNTKNIPAGFIARVLTPTGWQDKIYEAGQVDLGTVGQNGQGNVLVLVEATSIAIKEQFLKDNADKSDHRVMTKKKVPLEVDCYTRVMLPDSKEDRNSIFVQMTPKPTADPRIQKITLEDIYGQFAKMDVRGKIREIFTGYENDTQVIENMKKVNAELSVTALTIFKQNKVPLKLMNVQLSNMKVDDAIVQSAIKNNAAELEAAAIRTVGRAISENPGYVEWKKWDVIKNSGIKEVTVIDNGRGAPIAISPGSGRRAEVAAK